MKTNLIGISGKIGSGKDTAGIILQYLSSRNNLTGSQKEYLKDLKYLSHILDKKGKYKIKKYAGKLKDIVCLLIGCTRSQLEDREFKEKELGEEWLKYRIITKGLSNYYVNTLQEAEDNVRHPNQRYVKVIMTPRLMLQLLGTEAGRGVIHPSIWENALMSEYKPINNCQKHSDGLWYSDEHGENEVIPNLPNWIITDVRFPNEAQAIKDRGGIVIKVNRPIYKIFDVAGSRDDILIPFVKEYRREPTKEELESLRIGENGKYLQGKEHYSETALDDYEFDHVIDNNGSIEELVEKVKQLNLV